MGMNVSQLKEFQKRLEQLKEEALDKFCRDCSKALAARLLELVIPATPVYEDYDKEVNFTTKDGKVVSFIPNTGKQGGTLRRGWTAKTAEEALTGTGSPSAADQKAYIDSCAITKVGSTYSIEITNPVPYASYVEYGHRLVNDGWWDGKKFLKVSEEKLIDMAPAMLEEMLNQALKEAVDGK